MTPHDELLELLETFCRNDLTAEQQTRLQELANRDDESRRTYVRYVHMHICLRRAFEKAEPAAHSVGEKAPALPLAASRPLPRPSISRFGLRRPLLAASVLILLTAGFAFWIFHAAQPPAHVAVLSHTIGCGPEIPAPGAKLTPGKIELASGVAEITSGNGTVLVLEAPAVLELIDSARGFLHAGRVVVRVPPTATGYILETSKARLIDEGTEFGVDVDHSGDTLIQVFDGVVMADCKEEAQSERVTAGRTVQIGGQPGVRELPSSAERFVRRMPPPNERGDDWLVPYNQRRFSKVQIAPALGPVVIDGDLKDWNTAGAFFIACDEPFTANYNVRGMMMYDQKNLYIAAHVADPSPMCSVIDPITDPGAGWKGGSVQVRLSTDRQAGWPLTGQWAGVPGYRPDPLDKSPHLCHLTMWYYKPKELPCLHLAYGMHLRGDRVNPPGYQAAYRKDDNGQGYTMEYAIPWDLLNAAADPPQAGDVLGACWNVHWSDDEGRLWKGYLVDITNPKEKGFTYQRAATWGQAIYLK